MWTKSNLLKIENNLFLIFINLIWDVGAGSDKLKNVKSIGPDGLSGIFLYNKIFSLFSLIFSHFMGPGVYQSMFKMNSCYFNICLGINLL